MCIIVFDIVKPFNGVLMASVNTTAAIGFFREIFCLPQDFLVDS